MKLARHAKVVHPHLFDISGRQGKVIITPAGCGQAFQFKMGIVIAVVITQSPSDMAGIEKQGHMGAVFANGGRYPVEIILDGQCGEPVAIAGIGPVHPERCHLRFGGFRYGRQLKRDVHEDAVRIGKTLHDLFGLGTKIIEVWGRIVQIGPTRIAGSARDMRQAAIGRHRAPFGVRARSKLVPCRGQIDHGVDALGVQRVDLCPQQIKGQARVHLADIGRVIAVPMVALCEHRHAIHMRRLVSRAKHGRVKGRSDLGDQPGCVKVEVNLAKTHVGYSVHVANALSVLVIPKSIVLAIVLSGRSFRIEGPDESDGAASAPCLSSLLKVTAIASRVLRFGRDAEIATATI